MTITRAESWSDSLPWIDRPDADIDAYVRSVDREIHFDLGAKLRHWKEFGFAVFEQVVSQELLDMLSQDIEHLREHYSDYELSAELRGESKPIDQFTRDELQLVGVKFNNIHTISMAAARLSLTREVSVFLKHVFGSPACLLQSLTFYKGSQQSIHIDYPYVRCQTKLAHLAASWIPLEDINPDSGPVAYYAGSHRTEVTGFFDWGDGSILYESDSTREPIEFSNYLTQRMKAHGLKPQTFCPRRGDVFIWHGNLAHEGSKIARQELTRKSYVTHYTSLEGYPPFHKKPDAIHGKGAVVENDGYCFEYPWIRSSKKLPSWES